MFKQKAIKIFAVALAALVALCAPLTASAASYRSDIYLKSEFGYTLQSVTIYSSGNVLHPAQMYVNSFGNKDNFTFVFNSGITGEYYFSFKFKTNEDNYDGIEFDMEIVDTKYKGQQYGEWFRNKSSGNGTNEYNWFTGWVGSNKLVGKVSDQVYTNDNYSSIVSKHYFIQPPADGEKCNSYDFAFGVILNVPEAFELTFSISNFKFNQRQYNEKVEANKSGNDSIDGVTSSIPETDFSGIRDSLSLLTEAISYHGTDCVWTFPALYIPKIENSDTGQLIVPKIELTKERDIDLSAWVKKIPESVLLIIQSLCSIAVILFIVYEFYSFIVFCLTLKNNQVGKDEESED